jgi:hypothetical protein
MVNFMHSDWLLMWFRKSFSVSLSCGQIVLVSLTYLFQNFGFMGDVLIAIILKFSMDKMVTMGDKGDPMDTPSKCS